jgi:two-component system, LytTR family, sensor kinase
MKLSMYWYKYRSELLFYFGFLTILGIAFFIQTIYVDALWSEEPEKPTRELIINVFIDRVFAAYLWLLLTPLIIFVTEKISGKQFSIFITIVLHVVAALFFVFVHIPVYSIYVYSAHALAPWMYEGIFKKMPDVKIIDYVIGSMFRLNHVYRLLYYCILIAIHYAFDYFRKYTEREVHATQLEIQLKEAQLRTLHQQLQPHFLFNTLNGISSLMYKSIDEADKMLTYLGDLLRISLERMNIQEVPLKDDLAFIDRYLLIEKIRMGDRLEVKIDFHSDTLDALIPCMITQPILENAIKHGITQHLKKGTIVLSSWRNSDRLFIRIEDNGKGLNGAIEDNIKAGFGIKNTIERLKHLYVKDFSLSFYNIESGGLCVTLSIPFRIPK